MLHLASHPLRALSLCIATIITSASGAFSQDLSLLRDADVEHSLNRLAQPILQAAGFSSDSVKILVVDNPNFNSFVIDQSAIFLNHGLILKVTSPEMLQGIIAHETAHILNGHIDHHSVDADNAETAAGFGTALAILAAATDGSALGTQSATERGFVKHTRAEEASADQTALNLMFSADVDPQGLLDVHRLLAAQETLSLEQQDPYMHSHPVSKDRIRAAQTFVSTHKVTKKSLRDTAYWLSRAQGKISAFKRAPRWTQSHLDLEKYDDIRLMRSAIASFRENDLSAALAQIDEMIDLRPRDAHLHDLKGQFLFENHEWEKALASYERAATLAPTDALVVANLGRAELASGNTSEALRTMDRARQLDFRNTKLLRDMSLAYAQTNQPGMAAVVTAERYSLRGRLDDAGFHAKRAMDLLPNGSAPWRRAEDVLLAAEQDQKRKNQ